MARKKQAIDVELLARELTRSLRGRRSQTALSRRLGFRSNVLYAWEAGQRWPLATDFLRVAQRVGIDVSGGWARFFAKVPASVSDAELCSREQVAALIAELRGSRPLRALAKQVGVSRVSLASWLRAEGEPRLPELLKIVEVCSLRLLDFVALFVDPAQLKETRGPWADLEAQRRVAYELPWSHAILRMLETEAYRALRRHDAGWLAERLHIPSVLVETCVRALVQAKQIRRVKQRYVPNNVLTVDTTPSREQSRGLKHFWGDVALERMARLEGTPAAIYSYNLYAVAERDLPRVRELHFAYYSELRRLVAASEPSERLLLSNLWLIPLDE